MFGKPSSTFLGGHKEDGGGDRQESLRLPFPWLGVWRCWQCLWGLGDMTANYLCQSRRTALWTGMVESLPERKRGKSGLRILADSPEKRQRGGERRTVRNRRMISKLEPLEQNMWLTEHTMLHEFLKEGRMGVRGCLSSSAHGQHPNFKTNRVRTSSLVSYL